jgi:hypothetical protein
MSKGIRIMKSRKIKRTVTQAVPVLLLQYLAESVLKLASRYQKGHHKRLYFKIRKRRQKRNKNGTGNQ